MVPSSPGGALIFGLLLASGLTGWPGFPAARSQNDVGCQTDPLCDLCLSHIGGEKSAGSGPCEDVVVRRPVALLAFPVSNVQEGSVGLSVFSMKM